LNAPDGHKDLGKHIPAEVSVSHKLHGTFQQIHCFVQSKAELEQVTPQVTPSLEHDGLLWVYFPKKTSRVQTDLSRDHGWEVLQQRQFRSISLISLDNTWSAFAFRLGTARKKRPAPEASGEIARFVDRVRRVVNAPPDVRKAFQRSKRAAAAFEALSFTHKREYVVWILEARQSQTRSRRIKNLVDRLKK